LVLNKPYEEWECQKIVADLLRRKHLKYGIMEV